MLSCFVACRERAVHAQRRACGVHGARSEDGCTHAYESELLIRHDERKVEGRARWGEIGRLVPRATLCHVLTTRYLIECGFEDRLHGGRTRIVRLLQTHHDTRCHECDENGDIVLERAQKKTCYDR